MDFSEATHNNFNLKVHRIEFSMLKLFNLLCSSLFKANWKYFRILYVNWQNLVGIQSDKILWTPLGSCLLRWTTLGRGEWLIFNRLLRNMSSLQYTHSWPGMEFLGQIIRPRGGYQTFHSLVSHTYFGLLSTQIGLVESMWSRYPSLRMCNTPPSFHMIFLLCRFCKNRCALTTHKCKHQHKRTTLAVLSASWGLTMLSIEHFRKLVNKVRGLSKLLWGNSSIRPLNTSSLDPTKSPTRVDSSLRQGAWHMILSQFVHRRVWARTPSITFVSNRADTIG